MTAVKIVYDSSKPIDVFHSGLRRLVNKKILFNDGTEYKLYSVTDIVKANARGNIIIGSGFVWQFELHLGYEDKKKNRYTKRFWIEVERTAIDFHADKNNKFRYHIEHPFIHFINS